MSIRLIAVLLAILTVSANGQSLGSAGTVTGVVSDPNGAVVAGATVVLQNGVTGYRREVATDAAGTFKFNDVPPNTYQLAVSAGGFTNSSQTLNVRTTVPVNANVSLTVGSLVTSEVNIQSSETVLENVPSSHTDIDQSLIARLPVRSPGSGLSDVVTFAAPGVAADSNGFFHPLGDHAQSSIVLDNQSISDQTSKAFSTQLPVNAIQSLEVTTGAPMAEYGDKTSLIINAITRSGIGQKLNGSVLTRYGTFGEVDTEATLGFGNKKVGNFIGFNYERSGRFLDAPEISVFHDKGTATSIFDRIDYNASPKDTFHLNLMLARNRFDIPNTYEQEALGQDQRQLVRSINIAPGYVHIFSPSTVLTVNPYFRMDQVWYYPSPDPFSDHTQTISQQRRLQNLGIRSDIAYTKGIHNAKAGIQFSHTFLTEAFQFGITDPAFNDPESPDFIPQLLPFDLTRGGSLFTFNGHTDIKQVAVYVQDSITLGNFTANLGLRFDNYAGLVKDHLWEPRLGGSYLVKKTGTVLRGAYSRTFETPYNENLILSNTTGAGGLADGILGGATAAGLEPGRRHQFNAGFQQSLGRHIVIDADYFWKHTRNAYDFNVILNTPIAFPISWNKSKLDGLGVRVNFADYKGFSAFFTAGHTRARYFPPENGGLFFNSDLPEGVFRIDHDQAFQQTTQVQYQFHQFGKLAPYAAFSWRYDSGLVAGAVPDYATALGFSPDLQAQIGLFCGNVFATPTEGLTACTDPNRGATRIKIPADGTANDDHNPPRIAPRHLFDFSVGTDNLFRTDHTHIVLRLSATNLTNQKVLYNFLSTFSGTHFVATRAFGAQVGIVF
jgi:hypothetical protein